MLLFKHRGCVAMNEFIHSLICFIITGITGFVCLFLCFLSAHKKEIWEQFILKKEQKEEQNERNSRF